MVRSPGLPKSPIINPIFNLHDRVGVGQDHRLHLGVIDLNVSMVSQITPSGVQGLCFLAQGNVAILNFNYINRPHIASHIDAFFYSISLVIHIFMTVLFPLFTF